MGFPAGGSGGSSSPGFEIGYDQITASVTVASSTEATGTTVIACAAHSFDGSPVLATFFSSQLACGDQLGNAIVLSLFEGATQIGRIAQAQTPSSGASVAMPGLTGMLRFTPTAASHTYTVTVFASSLAGTAPIVQAGAGGTGIRVPAFIRFTKV